jgi:hypothetical protein
VAERFPSGARFGRSSLGTVLSAKTGGMPSVGKGCCQAREDGNLLTLLHCNSSAGTPEGLPFASLSHF